MKQIIQADLIPQRYNSSKGYPPQSCPKNNLIVIALVKLQWHQVFWTFGCFRISESWKCLVWLVCRCIEITITRWFKVTFSSPIGGHQQPLKRSFNHPKRVTIGIARHEACHKNSIIWPPNQKLHRPYFHLIFPMFISILRGRKCVWKWHVLHASNNWGIDFGALKPGFSQWPFDWFPK